MNLPIKKSAIDLDHLRQTVESAGWEMILEKFHREEQRMRDEMEAAKNWDSYLENRGRLKGLQLARQLPEILAKEISAQLAKEGR